MSNNFKMVQDRRTLRENYEGR